MTVPMPERNLMKSIKPIMLFLQNPREKAMILIHLVKGNQPNLTIYLITSGEADGMNLMKKINSLDPC